MIEPAAKHCSKADYFAVIGTSLQVYPAAGLMDFVPFHTPKFLVDPNAPAVRSGVKVIKEKASIGVPLLAEQLLTHLK
ncbi:NAD-dependent deacetylase [compost metagenome]